MKTVHLYDPATGEYGGIYDAQESPLEPGVFLTPDASLSTTLAMTNSQLDSLFTEASKL